MPAGDPDMLAALARQMDVDVLISGGTHRYDCWIALICPLRLMTVNVRLGLSHSNSKVVSSLTLGRQLGPGVVSGMGKVTCVPEMFIHTRMLIARLHHHSP